MRVVLVFDWMTYEKNVVRLEELGWFEDVESWFCHI